MDVPFLWWPPVERVSPDRDPFRMESFLPDTWALEQALSLTQKDDGRLQDANERHAEHTEHVEHDDVPARPAAPPP